MLESAARGLSRYGYGNLVLEQVAREAGYTRGALYHQFRDKEELALAVLEWVNETWWHEVGAPAEQQPDPVAALLALARGHAVYCRRDVARVMMALRVEFSGQDHPVGREIERVTVTPSTTTPTNRMMIPTTTSTAVTLASAARCCALSATSRAMRSWANRRRPV